MDELDENDEDLKFELPITPLEIGHEDSRTVGGLFPGKGFFYLPKTTCFDRDWAKEVEVGQLLEQTLMRNDHSDTKTAKLLSSGMTDKSPARFVMESLMQEQAKLPRVEPLTQGVPNTNAQVKYNSR
jgi:hypothetical protein